MTSRVAMCTRVGSRCGLHRPASHCCRPAVQARLATEEAVSRRASISGASRTFKGAAMSVMGKLRSSLDLSAYSGRVRPLAQPGPGQRHWGRLPAAAARTNATVAEPGTQLSRCRCGGAGGVVAAATIKVQAAVAASPYASFLLRCTKRIWCKL